MHCVRSSPKLRAALASAYFANMRAYRWQSRAISPPEEDALLRWCRLKGDPARDTEVQANSLQRHRPG
jgi:hypothetical protein